MISCCKKEGKVAESTLKHEKLAPGAFYTWVEPISQFNKAPRGKHSFIWLDKRRRLSK
jgi:hypothetical protein